MKIVGSAVLLLGLTVLAADGAGAGASKLDPRLRVALARLAAGEAPSTSRAPTAP